MSRDAPGVLAWDGTVIMRVRVPRQLHAFQPCEAVRRGERGKLRITVAAVEVAAYDHGIARKEMIGQGHVQQLQVMQAHAGGVVSAAPRRVNTHAPQTRVVQLYARRARAFDTLPPGTRKRSIILRTKTAVPGSLAPFPLSPNAGITW